MPEPTLTCKGLLHKLFYTPVFDICQPEDREYDWAANILPLPVDQRYGVEDMKGLMDAVEEAMELIS